jgi:serine/threonine protein kinase
MNLKSKSEQKKWYHIDSSPEEIAMVDDLLHRMLEISPVRRVTAEELLQHPWFQTV